MEENPLKVNKLDLKRVTDVTKSRLTLPDSRQREREQPFRAQSGS